MNRKARIYAMVAALAFCLATDLSKLNANETLHYSRRQLHQMMREAKKPNEYRLLADYFRQQQLQFRVKAEAAEEEWFHCARYFVLPTKFPTRADTAQALWRYYSYKAAKMAALASGYEQ